MAKSNNSLSILGRSAKIDLTNDPSLQGLSHGRVLPQALDMEQAVLGGIMNHQDAWTMVNDILRPESFYDRNHQMIYEAMLELFANQKPIDLLSVYEQLNKLDYLENVGGRKYLAELSNRVSSAANIEYHARIIVQKYIQRELIRVSTTTIKDSFEDTKDVFDLLDEAEKHLYDITEQNMNTGFERLGALARKAQDEISAVSQKSDGLTGISTGFTELDKITSGWQPSDLVIIAARPGMGKTAFALSLARNAAKTGKGVAVFSLEMSDIQLTQRMIAMEAEIDSHKLRNGQLKDYEWTKLQTAVEKMTDSPIFIDDTPGINIFELRAKCRRLKNNHDIQLILVDYLQLMSGGPSSSKSGNREQEISSISRALKGLAKELSVPVISLSQLSRAVETRGGDKRPVLSDLRESGAIEQDADIVTFIYRPDYYGVNDDEFDVPQDEAEIIIAKHRNGSTGSVKLRFIKEFVKFTDTEMTRYENPLSNSDFPAADDPGGGIITKPSRANEIGDIPF